MDEFIDRSIRIYQRLKRTGRIFFSQFGRFFKIQVETIPIVLDGKNVILSSPTATGKTEAVVSPVLERLLEEEIDKKLYVLYVCPTRALVNDLFVRLNGPLEELGISLAIKTADHPMFNHQKPQNFLITTPESLDSLLARHPDVFLNLRFVILDDIHLIDATYRGDQMRILLKRLGRLKNRDTNCYLLSATLSNPHEIASRYIKDFEIVQVEGVREIEYQLIDKIDKMEEIISPQIKKILIFCNSRREVESVTKKLQNLFRPDRVMAHHGSLSRTERLSAERFMREADWCICVATMTLEIGIDIGGIDAIVLFGVPPTISTLLQRVGRGNRKSNKTVAFGVYESEGEKNLFQKMFEMARAGELERFIYKPDLSVVVQQIFSYLFQRRSGVSSEELYEIFDSFCGREIFDEIVINLKNLEFVELRVNRWHATERLMELADRGVIHSNIPDTREYQVVDITSGRHLGDIIPPGVKTFLFAGRAWEIVRVEQDTIFVKQTKKAEPPKFQKRIQHGSFFKYLPKNIRDRLDQK